MSILYGFSSNKWRAEGMFQCGHDCLMACKTTKIDSPKNKGNVKGNTGPVPQSCMVGRHSWSWVFFYCLAFDIYFFSALNIHAFLSCSSIESDRSDSHGNSSSESDSSESECKGNLLMTPHVTGFFRKKTIFAGLKPFSGSRVTLLAISNQLIDSFQK